MWQKFSSISIIIDNYIYISLDSYLRSCPIFAPASKISYDRFYESFTEAYTYMEEQGYKVAGHPRYCYIDGIWNQEDPEKWLSIIQIPIEQAN